MVHLFGLLGTDQQFEFTDRPGELGGQGATDPPLEHVSQRSVVPKLLGYWGAEPFPQLIADHAKVYKE
jgi:hypothetical protein